jgi:hypothetical protein
MEKKKKLYLRDKKIRELLKQGQEKDGEKKFFELLKRVGRGLEKLT